MSNHETTRLLPNHAPCNWNNVFVLNHSACSWNNTIGTQLWNLQLRQHAWCQIIEPAIETTRFAPNRENCNLNNTSSSKLSTGHKPKGGTGAIIYTSQLVVLKVQYTTATTKKRAVSTVLSARTHIRRLERLKSQGLKGITGRRVAWATPSTYTYIQKRLVDHPPPIWKFHCPSQISSFSVLPQMPGNALQHIFLRLHGG